MTVLDQTDSKTAGVLAPPPLIYAGGLALGLLLQRWHAIRLLPTRLAAPVGIAVLLFGLIGLPAVLAFRRARTSPKPWKPTTALVTTGPYRLTRNPMYLGFTLLYLGTTIWVNTAWPMFLLPLVLISMHYGVIAREERYLEREFGEEYHIYKRRVRRWL